MQRRAAEESLTDHGKDNSNGRAHVGDAIRHKPGILGFLRQIGFMGATGFVVVFFDAMALIWPCHTTWAGSRLATKRVNARIAVRRRLRVYVQQTRSSSR